MNKDTQRAWVNEALDEVLEALACRTSISGILVFKGARVLNRRLESTPRQSYDIDSNLSEAFVRQFPSRAAQQQYIQAELEIALSTYFREQAIVHYEVLRVAVKPWPRKEHPREWNAFKVKITLSDRARPGTLGLPTLTIDLAAPEPLGPSATAPLLVGANEIVAYTLERIAGEKFRAFLSSLPTYRAKIHKPGEAVRAKDIYDIARIVAAKSLENTKFWTSAGSEFRSACECRFVDCDGLSSFEEQLEVTEAAYDADVTIPKDTTFRDAWSALVSVVRYFERSGLVPFRFPLP